MTTPKTLQEVILDILKEEIKNGHFYMSNEEIKSFKVATYKERATNKAGYILRSELPYAIEERLNEHPDIWDKIKSASNRYFND